jgi:hypothetical protein
MTVETTDVRSRPALDPGTTARLLGWGLTVWLAVAVSIRLAGHVLLSPATPLVLAGFFVAVVPLMALVTYPIYRWFGIPRGARPTAAALLSIPGMFLDVLLVLFAETLLPAMSVGAVVNFGAILLFGYAVVLVTGLVPGGRSGTDPGRS